MTIKKIVYSAIVSFLKIKRWIVARRSCQTSHPRQDQSLGILKLLFDIQLKWHSGYQWALFSPLYVVDMLSKHGNRLSLHGTMKPGLVFLSTGGYIQYQVLDQNGSGTAGKDSNDLNTWNSWKRTTHQILNMLALHQCFKLNFLMLNFGQSYFQSQEQGNWLCAIWKTVLFGTVIRFIGLN